MNTAHRVEEASIVMQSDANVASPIGQIEAAHLAGIFEAVCYGPDGAEKWRDTFANVIATVGANLALDTFLAGAAYTAVGPFLGIISSVSYAAGPAITDTMAAHAGWTEAGGTNAPVYSGNRPSTASQWAAAAAKSKALSSALTFSITSSGTVKGCFLVFGAGAVATKDNTGGVLLSAGVFTGGDKIVSSGDTLSVSYSLGI